MGINLQTILSAQIPNTLKQEGYNFGDIDNGWILNAMKEAIHQALELAAEKATIRDKEGKRTIFVIDGCYVNKQSILDTIKQVR